jgi:hypothetical protein
MGRSRVLLLFVLLLLAIGFVAGFAAIDTEPTCPVEHQELRHGDVEREFLVQYPVLSEDLPIVDHAWVAIHDNSSVAIGSVFGARTVVVHPDNGTVDHQSQSFDGEWQTPDGNVSLWVDFRTDEAKITIENAVLERSIEGPVVEYCGPLGG